MNIVTERIINDLGRVIYLNPDDPRAHALARADGNFNPGSLDLWNALLEVGPEWNLAVDIGANYGEMLAGSRVRPAARVVAIEPNPTIASLLRHTCDELPFKVELIEKVISYEEAGGLSFAVDTAWSGTSHIAAGGETLEVDRFDVIEVSSTTLDALFPGGVPAALLKIDVEGAELHVLQGARKFLAASGRVAIMLEVFHMAVQDFWEFQKGRPVYLWNAKSKSPVALDVRSPSELGTLLHSGEYYRQDAVLLEGADVGAFDAELRVRFGTTRERSEHKAAEARRKVDESARAIVRLHEELEVQARSLDGLRAELAASERTIVRLNADLADRGQYFADLERTIADVKRGIVDRDQAIANRDRTEAELRNQLERYRLSRAHRLAALYVKIAGRVRKPLRG